MWEGEGCSWGAGRFPAKSPSREALPAPAVTNTGAAFLQFSGATSLLPA